MSARDKLIRRLSEDSLGGIATLHDVTDAEQLLDAYRAEVLRTEMANLRRIEREETPEGALGTRTGLLRAALILDERAEAADEKATAPAATATPDFFQPGHTYTVNAPFMAPEIRASFQCIAVATHPTTGNRRALGFEQEGAGCPWRSSSMRDEEWADGWLDITEGGASDA